MSLFYEILPVFLFFLAFKFYDIYVATLVGIIATFIQVMVTRLHTKRWDKKQLITFAVFVIFGSMTLYFHNPIFIKWKPTIIFWIFAIIIFVTQRFAKKTLIERMMGGVLQEQMFIPSHAWRVLNLGWGVFFFLLGSINLYIAYYFSNDIWVNFKFYGITGALFLSSIIQVLYLSRFMQNKKSGNSHE